MFKYMKRAAAYDALLTLCEELGPLSREATANYEKTNAEYHYGRAKALLEVRSMILDRVKV